MRATWDRSIAHTKPSAELRSETSESAWTEGVVGVGIDRVMVVVVGLRHDGWRRGQGLGSTSELWVVASNLTRRGCMERSVRVRNRRLVRGFLESRCSLPIVRITVTVIPTMIMANSMGMDVLMRMTRGLVVIRGGA